jgi:predicted nucleic acid-binding protein
LKVYADSSFIVALYLHQQNSRAAMEFMQLHAMALPFTPWHRLEVRTAIRVAAFHRFIDSNHAKTHLKQLEADLRDETFIVHAPIDWVAVLREAEKLGAAHNESVGCRAGDLFHVATAKEWRVDQFLTFDERQKKMAKASGLIVIS